MTLLPVPLILAELPPDAPFFGPVKVAVFLLLGLTWAATGAWVDKDTLKAKTPRLPWNAAHLGAGLLGLALWLVLPWIAGLFAFLLLYAGAGLAYVTHRNGRVAPAQRVLTPAHFQRLFSKKPETEETIHAGDRVRIKGADGRQPKWPTDPEERAGYAALQDLLFDAIWRRATVVDMALQGDAARILYRVDGVNRERESMARPLADGAVGHLKRVAGMDPQELRKPQSGKLTGAIGPGGKQDKVVEIQVQSSGDTTRQRVTMRLLSEESRFRLPEIGLSDRHRTQLEDLIAQRPHGVIIVCGPRESGLTSTLYAFIRGHDAFMKNIHTLEMSKAMEIENVTQTVFDSRGGEVTYSRQLQSVLRMDPDVVLVSDCPDRETAELVAAAGNSNKRVYVGLSASDTLSALRRYLQLVGDNELAAGGLDAVMAQRLVRKLCTECRKAYKPDPVLLKKANLPVGENRPFYRPPNPNELEVDKKGNPIVCSACQGSGYIGRTGIFEVLVVDDEIRALLARGAPLQNVKAVARKNGMQYLQEAGIHCVYEGVTSINEVLRVTREDPSARPAASAGA